MKLMVNVGVSWNADRFAMPQDKKVAMRLFHSMFWTLNFGMDEEVQEKSGEHRHPRVFYSRTPRATSSPADTKMWTQTSAEPEGG